MRDFSIGEAIAYGFRLPRERPAAMASWIGVEFVSGLLSTIIAAPLAPSLERLREQMSSATPDPAQVAAVLEAMAPRMLLMTAVFLVARAVLAAAAARAVLRPEASRFGYVRLGAVEMRVLVALLMIVGILFLAYMAGSLVASLLVAAFAGPAAVVIVVPFILLALVWLWSRLSPAAAMTVASGRVQVAEAWRLTRGRARRVFLVNLAALGLSSVVWLLGLLVFAGIVGALGVDLADASQPMAWFSLAGVLSLLASAVLGALSAAIVLCPPAVIYRDLAGEDVHDVF